jgi:hypothetical protein
VRQTTIAKTVVAAALLAALIPSSAQAAFGFKAPPATRVEYTNEDGAPATQAGSHPFAMTTRLAVNTISIPEGGSCQVASCDLPDGEVEDLEITFPAGFTGNTFATPRCTTADFIHRVDAIPSCPNASAVGISAVKIDFKPLPVGETRYLHVPVYNLIPPPGVAAKLGFAVLNVPVTVDLTVEPSPPYRVKAHVTNIAQAAYFYASALTVWGNPAADVHDPLRGRCLDVIAGTEVDEPKPSGKECPADTPERAFTILPRRCGALGSLFEARAWNSGLEAQLAVPAEDGQGNELQALGCERLDFSPRFGAQPTSQAAESPTGFDFSLEIEDLGLTDPEGLAASDLKKAVVALPEGVTANPSQAEGLEVCTEAGFAAEKATSAFGAGCPAASKLGTVEVQTPILPDEVLKGSVFIAEPYRNPFGTLLALYTTIKSPERGISIGIAAKVEPDPRTGRLIATFDDLPQQPFSDFRFRFREGARSPLVLPPRCGTYTTEADFYPWATPEAPVHAGAGFEVLVGPNGGPCPPPGPPPFHPGFEAGSLNNAAGAYSPFLMRLTRADGEQDMTRFAATLPPGVLGRLAGLGKCPEAAIAAARQKTGLEERANPSCPASSEIGRTLAGAGAGSALTYVPGRLYLAGPFAGDPLSVVAITPAVAGPFDVGTVVVREALDLDPKSAEVRVDGAASEPIPHILAGIPLKLRELRVFADRPQFTLNPTSCDEERTQATLLGASLDLFSPADDVPAALSARYQAAACAGLGFKPRLRLNLQGGTRRGAHPSFKATYTPRAGDANLEGLVVRLPRSAFLDQAHIRTICTRVQFAADACPPGAQYGFIKATTPLLEEPLQGPVWLRSSDHNLPDLVFDLHGLVDIEVATRIDSVRGGIRATLTGAPDAPITQVELSMQGGRKGLIVNSRNLCSKASRAGVRFVGQNGKASNAKPALKADCSAKGKRRNHRGGR